jgi:hypothetical protein
VLRSSIRPRYLVNTTLLWTALLSAAGFGALGGVASAAPSLDGAKSGTKAKAKASAPSTSDTVTTIASLTGTGMSLTLATATVAALKAVGVTIAPEGTASLVSGGAAMNFPITSGYAEVHSDRSFKPSYVLGSIEHYGSGITLGVGGTSVNLTDLVVDLGESMIYGTIGTTEDVPLLSLGRRSLTVKQTGGVLVVGGLAADLTATGASELDALFHTTAITANMPLGTVQITASGKASSYTDTDKTSEIPRLSGIATSVTLASAARDVLARVGAAPGAYGSATYDSGTDKLSFPITGGTAVIHGALQGRAGYVQGVVLQQGSGIVLTRGSTSVTMTDLTVAPGAAKVYASVNGGADNATLFTMVTKEAEVKMVGGNVEITGVVLDLTTDAAAMLNSVFATTDFIPGTELGTVDLVASGR